MKNCFASLRQRTPYSMMRYPLRGSQFLGNRPLAFGKSKSGIGCGAFLIGVADTWDPTKQMRR